MTDKIEIRKDEDGGIGEVIMPSAHLEMLGTDHASLSFHHEGDNLLIEITATATEEVDLVSGRRASVARLSVTVADRWDGDE